MTNDNIDWNRDYEI